jgi:hypothetical protein
MRVVPVLDSACATGLRNFSQWNAANRALVHSLMAPRDRMMSRGPEEALLTMVIKPSA